MFCATFNFQTRSSIKRKEKINERRTIIDENIKA